MTIQDSVIIVTGASSGIGLAIARLLAQKGATVMLVARSADRLAALAAELPGSHALPADMSDLAAVRSMAEKVVTRFGRVDALINNAGRGYDASIEEIDPAEYESLLRLNVIAPLVAMQAVIPAMRAQGGGNIVNIGSGTVFRTVPNIAAYSSSKRALTGLTLTARRELEADGITVSMVHPSITATDFPTNKVRGSRHVDPAAYASGDTPEYVAEIVLKALEEGGEEYRAH